MFNPFVWLDSALLSAAQKFCDKFQRVTGLTKFAVSKWALILGTLLFWANEASDPSQTSSTVILIFATVGHVGIVYLLEKEEEYFLRNHKLLASLIFYFKVPFRILFALAFEIPLPIFFIASIVLEVGGFMFCGGVFFILFLYSGACIPRPPSKSKMREWYERVLTALNDSLKPEPALIPIPVNSQ